MFRLVPEFLALWFLVAIPGEMMAQTARIHGRVTDFAGAPLAGAEVMLKRADFEDAAKVVADSQGRYSMDVPAGRYCALVAVRGYQVQNLEYWAWDVPASDDLVIDCRVDGLELYGIHAWRPRGAAPSYLVYFRPMSLRRCGQLIAEHGPNALESLPVLAIGPELRPEDVTVDIDGDSVPVLTLSRTRESAGPGRTMDGWLAQVGLPAMVGQSKSSRLSLEVVDRLTGERGAGCVFLDAADRDAGRKKE
jgi:hypothetical protein